MKTATFETQQFGPFALTLVDDGIGLVLIDVAGEKQNVLRAEYIADASRLLDLVQDDRRINGLIFESAKEDSFVAGADIRMLLACTTAEEASALSREGQQLFGRIETCRVPVVAAINGACLGGGLEMALACHGRVCTDEPSTVLGTPEVRLGVLPGSGGTQRLPRLVGLQVALDMMLTGRHVRPRRAKKIGLVGEVVPRTILRTSAVELVRRLSQRHSRRTRRRGVVDVALEGNPVGRKIVFSMARRNAQKATGGHYPAPPAIIDCVEAGLSDGIEKGLLLESQRFGELAMTTEAAALMGLFLDSTELKGETGVSDPAARPKTIRRVGILGAGLMGAGIAYVTCSKAEAEVRLKDRDEESLAKGLKYVNQRIERSVKRSRLDARVGQKQLSRITTTLDYSGFKNVDLVIEAVFEDLDLKRRIVAEVEDIGREDLIFATNTSSIPVSQIAAEAQRPENIVGMHYFSPVERMPLLEIVVTDVTSPVTVATAVQFGKRQGKTVIVVRDGPGFYVNRILAPYLNEAGRLLQEGVRIDRIDRAATEFGFPLGPFALMDEVGLDVAAKVATVLQEAFGFRMGAPTLIERMLDKDRRGKKAGRGFYRYTDDGKRKEVDSDVYELVETSTSNTLKDSLLRDRLVLPLVNEAVRCLEESVIRSARDGDVGAVFGIGFPPFIGGPFRYIDVVKPSNVLSTLQNLSSEVGDRFAPAQHLRRVVAQNSYFHERN